MIIDISNPECDVKELFKKFCEGYHVFLEQSPKDCFYNVDVAHWTMRFHGNENYQFIIKQVDKLIKVWINMGWIEERSKVGFSYNLKLTTKGKSI